MYSPTCRGTGATDICLMDLPIDEHEHRVVFSNVRGERREATPTRALLPHEGIIVLGRAGSP